MNPCSQLLLSPAGLAGTCAAKPVLNVRKLNLKLFSYSFPEDNVFFTNNLGTVRSSSSSSECLTKALGVSSEGSLESNEVGFSFSFLFLPLTWPVLSPLHSLC